MQFLVVLMSWAVRLLNRCACMACYGKTFNFTFNFLYCPMVQDVGDRPITAETRFLSQTGLVGLAIHALTLGRVSLLGISIFPCQYNSTVAT
jgi:hypothetical protein